MILAFSAYKGSICDTQKKENAMQERKLRQDISLVFGVKVTEVKTEGNMIYAYYEGGKEPIVLELIYSGYADKEELERLICPGMVKD